MKCKPINWTGICTRSTWDSHRMAIKLTTGFARSPSTIHKSLIVCNPTSRTTNSPTNFTLIVQASIVPVKNNQYHHLFAKVWPQCVAFDNLTIPITEAVMKHNRIGSSRMYWFSVNMPTSEMRDRKIDDWHYGWESKDKPNNKYAAAISAASLDSVSSQIVENVIGTIRAPSVVQN